MIKLPAVAIGVTLFFAGQTIANTTPNHVYVVTEKTIDLLKSLSAANFSSPDYPEGEAMVSQPRHVLQLAGDVWRKTQLLRFMNGLPTQGVKPIPARAITPTDVKATVDEIYVQLEELLPTYGVATPPGEPDLPTGKTPSDVFANLMRVSAGLDSLGIPATVPNDVNQIASTVLNDAIRLADVAGAPGAKAAISQVPRAQGQTPKDAYLTAMDLLKNLQSLAEEGAGTAIKGGVTIPAVKDKVTPADVIVILLRARAEINAMRVVLGDPQFSEIAVYEGGKTPSDVVTKVRKAQAVIRNIKNNIGG